MSDTLGRALLAPGPHEALGDHAQVFDRVMGVWDCDYTHFAEDGMVVEHYTGEVTFGWVLDGWAVQDVWLGEVPHEGATRRSIGTTIRFLDRESGVWHILWIMPENGTVTRLSGGAVGDRIVLEGVGADGAMRRWSFNDIRPESFVWRGERSTDGGRTWFTQAEYQLRRR